jgi:intracellular sulfur oxidation DsrE/DsrF family protein
MRSTRAEVGLLVTVASGVVALLLTVTTARAMDAGLPETEYAAIGVADAPDVERQREVYDVSLHDPQALQLLLGRLEQLAHQPHPRTQPADIALVLHGPELKFFSIDNYMYYRDLVDLAAKLDAFQVVEVKACNTKLRALGLQPQDLPAFIEIVPYGPGEVERLVDDGYLRM